MIKPKTHLVWAFALGSVAFLLWAPLSIVILFSDWEGGTGILMAIFAVIFFLPAMIIALFGLGQSIRAIRKLVREAKPLREAIIALALNLLPLMIILAFLFWPY